MAVDDDRLHLGDGAYVHSDGYYLWVTTDRGGVEHRVALEPSAFIALVEYAVRLEPGLAEAITRAAAGPR
jgi:hypothetical protein